MTIDASRPLLAITMGDAAGIGPEVIGKALAREEVTGLCRPLVVGSAAVLERVARLVGADLTFRPVVAVAEARFAPGVVDVLDDGRLGPDDFQPGRISAAAGRAAMEYIIRAADLAARGEVAGIVTAPINKEATKLGGYADVGHLELLARLTGATEYATMLATRGLRVVHLTTHHSLRRACDLVTQERVLARIELTHRSFVAWGFTRPRIGVAALNPHAGEGGLFGEEESQEIAPAVRAAVEKGIDARGPFPADSIFNRAIDGEFDAIIAMYHDQGHIPVKVHGFAESVSVALGLPLLRTSVDHGTAYDIAWQGKADEQSMVEAIRTAADLARRRE